jgi:integrase
MGGRPQVVTTRAQGNIETLPSGARRVRVYAGIDPVTKKRHVLTEVIPPGPKAARLAESARHRLLQEVAERRNPRTSATVDQLLDRYLDQFSGAPNTLELYRGHVRNHISPVLGKLKVGQLDAEVLDSFYAELRRCRSRCPRGRRTADHRTAGPHECDDRCHPHQCRPLAATTIRHMHYILSGAYKRAVRWRWVGINPTEQVEPPPPPKSNPQPPSAEDAARIINAAWRDQDWGTLVWVATTSGARRGELCAIRRSSINLDPGRESIWLRTSIRRDGAGGWTEGDLKTHQQRRIALDTETATALREHLDQCRLRAKALGIELPESAFVFSTAPDGSTHLVPDSVTQRYDRLARRLGVQTTFHKLRHYSATELILAGVDIRTVAGRLGHGGGGTTTLKTYTAWVSEADQRAAAGLAARMPQRRSAAAADEQVAQDPRSPYERIASVVRSRIIDGSIAVGGALPTGKALGMEFGTATATAQRAVALLKEWGLVDVRRGQRAVVVARPAR